MADEKDDIKQQGEQPEETTLKEEKKAEDESEAGEHGKEAKAEDIAGTADEEAQKAETVEQGAGVEEETPAEVAAVHTDTEAAAEASEEVKPEEKAPKPVKEDKPKPTGKFKDLIKEIENLSVADLAQLVKALEERFGVSAAVPVAGNGAAAPAAGGEEQKEEKTTYTVVLTEAGAQKIAVIKAVREINQQLGLKEAKDLVEAAPKEVAKDIPAKEAEEAKQKLEAAGAKVELK